MPRARPAAGSAAARPHRSRRSAHARGLTRGDRRSLTLGPSQSPTEQILGGGGTEFTALLETLGEAVTIRDLDDNLVFANRAALRQLGFESVEAVRQRSLDGVMADYIVHDEHGRPLSMADIPSVRLLAGEDPEPLLIHTVHPGSGASRWQLLKAAGLHDGEGRLVAAVTVIEDLTAVKTAEVHMRILSESGRILGSSLDLGQTLDNVAQAAVPGLADWCVVDVIDHEMVRRHVSVAHRDAGRRDLLQHMRELEPAVVSPESVVGRVRRSGRPELLFDVGEEHLRRIASSQEHFQVLQALAIRSAIAVPLRARGATIGVMTCCTSESQRRFTTEDLELAEQLAWRAAIAVDNARLHSTLQGVSETLQQSLRPTPLPPIPGWEIAALYHPAGSELRVEVGGDFYELLDDGPATLALIGDVTGHGVTAATVTAMLRHGARFASQIEPSPAAILGQLDEALRRREDAPLCTALCARLLDGALAVSSAGHPSALIVRADGSVSECPPPGPLLGAFADARWEEQVLPVGPEDLVLLYTDGITEASGRHDRFGAERLRSFLARHAGAEPAALLSALEATLVAFVGGEPSDDMAALALRPAG